MLKFAAHRRPRDKPIVPCAAVKPVKIQHHRPNRLHLPLFILPLLLEAGTPPPASPVYILFPSPQVTSIQRRGSV